MKFRSFLFSIHRSLQINKKQHILLYSQNYEKCNHGYLEIYLNRLFQEPIDDQLLQ